MVDIPWSIMGSDLSTIVGDVASKSQPESSRTHITPVSLISLMPMGRRYKSLKTVTSRKSNRFFSTIVRLHININ